MQCAAQHKDGSQDVSFWNHYLQPIAQKWKMMGQNIFKGPSDIKENEEDLLQNDLAKTLKQ